MIHAVLFLCALLSVLTTAGIIWVLTSESFHFFREISFGEFFGTSGRYVSIWLVPPDPTVTPSTGSCDYINVTVFVR